jgi:DNA-binding transcriptional ArsR family regulator
VRRRILRLLREREETRSPARLARELDLPPSTVSYHLQILLTLGALTKTGESRVRGRVEHLYEAAPDADGTIEELLEETRDFDEGA